MWEPGSEWAYNCAVETPAKKQLLLGVIFVSVLVLSLLVLNLLSGRGNSSPSIAEDAEIELYVNDVKVSDVSTTTVSSTTLRPSFKITLNRNYDILEIKIDGLEVASDPELTEFASKSASSKSFTPTFLLKPGIRSIEILAVNDDATVSKKFTFSLNLRESFDQSIAASEFLLIPDSTSDNYPEGWVVKDGRVVMHEVDGASHASLAFLYPFKDIDLTFTFRAQETPLNLAFYFLDRGRTFVIGNGGLSRMTLLRRDENSVDGEPFPMQPNTLYTARVVRVGSTYDLFLSSRAGDWQHVLSFNDELDAKDVEDSVGFSLWPGSKGVEIDDLSLFSEI